MHAYNLHSNFRHQQGYKGNLRLPLLGQDWIPEQRLAARGTTARMHCRGPYGFLPDIAAGLCQELTGLTIVTCDHLEHA